MPKYNGNDIYCDLIIPRKIEVKLVKKTKNVLAFYHTKPSWPIHIVVTTKEHILSLLELNDELAIEILSVVKEVASELKKQNGACRVLTNIGEYQDSKHLHIHITSGQFN